MIITQSEPTHPAEQNRIEIILLRQWASHLAAPVFIVGNDGELIFYNEPAELLLGQRYDETGELPLEQLSDVFKIAALDGSPLPYDEIPLGIALLQGRPAQARVRYYGFDGRSRVIDVTAFPVDVHDGERVGAVAIFWEVDEG
jgi:PAS domain-containing protein